MTLQEQVHALLEREIEESTIALNELTVTTSAEHLLTVCTLLRDHPALDFKLLIDICGVDYLHYGKSEWQTESATFTGFSRGVEVTEPNPPIKKRFASVYHLLSITHNQRIRIKVHLTDPPKLPSVVSIWPAANWYEREAFDLLGIMYEGHPDLRRILTDYGFHGHPFRKDFPLIGNVEARYDAKSHSVVYEPVSITPRILEPKVIRDDNRYKAES